MNLASMQTVQIVDVRWHLVFQRLYILSKQKQNMLKHFMNDRIYTMHRKKNGINLIRCIVIYRTEGIEKASSSHSPLPMCFTSKKWIVCFNHNAYDPILIGVCCYNEKSRQSN